MYDDLVFEELTLTKQARKYQLDLERLAGKKTVQNLNLYQYAFKNELFSSKNVSENNIRPNSTPLPNGGKNVKK